MLRLSTRRFLLPILRRVGYIQGLLDATYVHPFRTTIPALFSSVSESGEISSRDYNKFDSSATSNEAQKKPSDQWPEEQARVLRASLPHVIGLGWSDAAMIRGARELGISPSIVGSIPRKEVALVEFFMDDCLQKLIDIIDEREDLEALIPSERARELIKIRLQMQAPYISKWPQALSIQVQPTNISTSIKQRSTLVSEIMSASNDTVNSLNWHLNHTLLGGIYSAAEIYMLTDASPDFQDTWTFLDERIRDAYDFKNTVQEAKHFAETVEVGIQKFAKKILQG